MLLLLESVDAPGEAVSLSIQDSKEDAEAYEKSGLYEKQVKKALTFLTEAPKLKSYEVTVVHQAQAQRIAFDRSEFAPGQRLSSLFGVILTNLKFLS